MFTISEQNGCICVKASADESRVINLREGGFKWSSRTGMYPLTEANIDILYRYKQGIERKSYPFEDYTIVWKHSIIEAFKKFYDKKFKTKTDMDFLSSLKIDTISRFPKPLESINGNPPPFGNQHISQFWSQRTDDHALLWEMGTGKTRGAIENWMLKKKQDKVDKGLVVCPVSMLDKWVVEIEKWSDTKAAIALKGSRQQKIDILHDDWDWYVVTFESLALLIDEFEEIVDNRWLVVLDEFTKIKNPHAKRSKACIRLGELTKHKAILSGTPITQHAYDIFTPFRFLDMGETFGLNYDQFIDRYFWQIGYKKQAKRGALDEISRKMYHKSTRFLKKDCIDIPDKVYDQRLLELPPYNKQRYDEMVMWAITQIEGSDKVTAAVILVQLLRLSQITSGFVKDATGREIDFDDNPKIDALEDIFEETNGSKIVVWCRFIHDVNNIAKLCDKMKLKYVTLHGETKPDERTRNIAAFQNDSTVKVIIGTAGTGGHGIDLTAAQVVVYFSNSYSLEQRLQSEDRAHRAGQVNKVTYIDLLCKETIDIGIYKILREKKNIADIVTKDNVRALV